MQADSALKSIAPPPALHGARREIDADTVGRLSWYQAGRPAPGVSLTLLVLVHSVNAAASVYEVKPLYQQYARTRLV